MSAIPSGSRGQLGSGAYVDYTQSPLDPDEPTNVDTYIYQGGAKWGISWTSASPSYYTQYSLDNGATVEGEQGPGRENVEGFYVPVDPDAAVRHRNGSRYSSWVSALEV